MAARNVTHTAARSSTLISFIKRSRWKRDDIPLPHVQADLFSRLIGAGLELKAPVHPILDHLEPVPESRTAHLWHRPCNTLHTSFGILCIQGSGDRCY